MNGEYAALAGRLREALEDLERVVEQTRKHWGVARATSDEAYWNSVALNLHGFYVGAERICEDIAKTVDTSVPSGRSWHYDLLQQVSAEITGVRPAVIQRETRQCLDAYREFRHIVRNVYTFNLRPARLDELAAGLSACFDAVSHDLTEFAVFLDQVAQADDDLSEESE